MNRKCVASSRALLLSLCLVVSLDGAAAIFSKAAVNEELYIFHGTPASLDLSFGSTPAGCSAQANVGGLLYAGSAGAYVDASGLHASAVSTITAVQPLGPVGAIEGPSVLARTQLFDIITFSGAPREFYVTVAATAGGSATRYGDGSGYTLLRIGNGEVALPESDCFFYSRDAVQCTLHDLIRADQGLRFLLFHDAGATATLDAPAG